VNELIILQYIDIVCISQRTIVGVLAFYSAAALLAMQSAVLSTAIPSVCLSVRHTLVLYPNE